MTDDESYHKMVDDDADFIKPILTIFPCSMETQIRKLKLTLEQWREFVLLGNRILIWEKRCYATGIMATVTTVFAILWLCQPTLLTMAAALALILTVFDYFGPLLLKMAYPTHTWTTQKQREFEAICTNLILLRTKAELATASFGRLRVTNPKLYFAVSIFVLSLLTWLGASFDNLLLSYLTVLFAAMLPGMKCHGMLSHVNDTIGRLFNELVENAKTKKTE